MFYSIGVFNYKPESNKYYSIDSQFIDFTLGLLVLLL